MTPFASRIQALQDLISPVFLRRDVNDIGVPMVEREIHLIKTNFIPEQKKAYDMISSSNDHPTVKMWEQRKNTILFPGSKKIEILTKLVYDVLRKKEQVIIYTGMVETGEFYQKMFSYVSRLVNGNILPSDQARIIDDFKKGKFEILIAGIEIGSTGHSLQNANNVIMTDFPWTSTSFDQAIARPWRINSKKKVNIYLISMNGSIDEEMNELIDTKRETSEMVLDGVNDYKVTNWKL
ncbi:MAG: C-terminal helicase domain-containing protein [Ignavibacteriae bacterium]|nr:C-terminal helicase domain-containing protein [Ignavibacteriota bacterium]